MYILLKWLEVILTIKGKCSVAGHKQYSLLHMQAGWGLLRVLTEVRAGHDTVNGYSPLRWSLWCSTL